jgi:hypothetical protein
LKNKLKEYDMPTIKIKKYETVPDSVYRVRITGAELRERKDTSEKTFGSDQFIMWDLVIVPGYGQPYEGTTLSHITGIEFGNKSQGYKFLRAAGMPEQEKVIDVETEDYTNRELIVRTEVQEDSKKNKVNKCVEFYSLEEFKTMQSRSLTDTPIKNTVPKIEIPPAQQSNLTTPGKTNLVQPDLTANGKPGAGGKSQIVIPPTTGVDIDFPKDE